MPLQNKCYPIYRGLLLYFRLVTKENKQNQSIIKKKILEMAKWGRTFALQKPEFESPAPV